MNEKIYNCKKITIYPPKNLIKCNCLDEYKESVMVDECVSTEILYLWSLGVKTTGCCCGHGRELGFIQVRDEKSVEIMLSLGYQHYIYPKEFGGVDRRDAFIPKSNRHIYDGYSDEYMG